MSAQTPVWQVPRVGKSVTMTQHFISSQTVTLVLWDFWHTVFLYGLGTCTWADHLLPLHHLCPCKNQQWGDENSFKNQINQLQKNQQPNILKLQLFSLTYAFECIYYVKNLGANITIFFLPITLAFKNPLIFFFNQGRSPRTWQRYPFIKLLGSFFLDGSYYW